MIVAALAGFERDPHSRCRSRSTRPRSRATHSRRSHGSSGPCSRRPCGSPTGSVLHRRAGRELVGCSMLPANGATQLRSGRRSHPGAWFENLARGLARPPRQRRLRRPRRTDASASCPSRPGRELNVAATSAGAAPGRVAARRTARPVVVAGVRAAADDRGGPGAPDRAAARVLRDALRRHCRPHQQPPARDRDPRRRAHRARARPGRSTSSSGPARPSAASARRR